MTAEWIPCCLCVVVRVHIHPTGCHEHAVGIDDARTVAVRSARCADFRNDAVFKRDIGVTFGRSRAVHEPSIGDDGAA